MSPSERVAKKAPICRTIRRRSRPLPRCAIEILEGRRVPAVITVTSADDNMTVNGMVTLREAIAAANTDTSIDGSVAGKGADVILFAPSVLGKTITLGGSPLSILSPVQINAPGEGQITISGNGASQVLQVEAGGKATLTGLSITKGSAFRGGGIANAGTLTLTLCRIADNQAVKGMFPSPLPTGGGGGIWNTGLLTLNACTVSGNFAEKLGGGIWNTGTLSIGNSALSGNAAGKTDDDVAARTSGGGLYDSGITTIARSSITGNRAFGGGGGGVFASGTFTITDSTVSDNLAGSPLPDPPPGNLLSIAAVGGGGLRIDQQAVGSTATIRRCTITGNITTTGGDGAGLSHTGNGAVISLLVEDSTFAGNKADGRGGGIAVQYTPRVSITGSTITGNSSNESGGGVHMGWYYQNPPVSPVISRSTIADNAAVKSSGNLSIFNFGESLQLKSVIVSGGTAPISRDISGTCKAEYSLIQSVERGQVIDTVPGSNRFGVDPLLGPLADNGGPTLTRALLPGSPAINRGGRAVRSILPPGTWTASESFDQRGLGYVRSCGRPDIGAFEVQIRGAYLAPDVTDPSKNQLCVVGSPGNDTISIALSGDTYNVGIGAKTVKLPSTNVVGVVVRAHDGDDSVSLASSVSVGALVDGGDGDDTISVAAGNNILLGGQGSDVITGGNGRDIVIGGDGFDIIAGGIGDDILIAGSTDFDDSAAGLLALRAAWIEAVDTPQRVAKIIRGVQGIPRLFANTVWDGNYDELTCDSGDELVFADSLDKISGKAANDTTYV